MKNRILFINPPSDYFIHIPMGTFGLSDYLNRTGFKSMILNLSLYETNDLGKHLDQCINDFSPSYVGIMLHWQESIEGFIWTGEYIKKKYNDIKIVCGGFTAGYFGENLLKKFRFLDVLIKGDPEKPLELLLEGEDYQNIPNIIYRSKNEIFSNRITYYIDESTLSNISFCNLDLLFDYDKYISLLEKGLGFPLFIGRGCVNNCSYCGGSSKSYRLHSERTKPVFRSFDSIMSDLKKLDKYTNKVYICYDLNRDFIKGLFREIINDKNLKNKFILNYGAWALLDEEFLVLYKDAFCFSANRRPVIELSPEVFDDDVRKQIKGSNNYYSIDELIENINLINSIFDKNIYISLYFSRYHEGIDTFMKIRREIADIYKLKNEILMSNKLNVVIRYDHLSTDVGSTYWEKYISNPYDVDTLVSGFKVIKTHQYHSFPYNNICLFIPEKIKFEEILKSEKIIFLLRLLEENFIELFHILLRRLGRDIIEIIEEVIEEKYTNDILNIFTDISYYDLLINISEKIQSNSFYFERIPFIDDLIKFSIIKDKLSNRRCPIRISYQVNKPKINHSLISIHENDYLNFIVLLRRMEREKTFAARLTVYIYLIDEILTMPFETYSETIKRFEDGISLEEYYDLMEKNKLFTISYHKELVKKLFESYVLY